MRSRIVSPSRKAGSAVFVALLTRLDVLLVGAATVCGAGRALVGTAVRLPAFASNLRHMLSILTHGLAAPPSDLGHMLGILADGLAAFSSDLRHVFSILAHRLSAFVTRSRVPFRISVPAASFPGAFAAVLGRLIVSVVFVALLTSFYMLLVRTASACFVRHLFLPCPRTRATRVVLAADSI